MSDNSAGPSKAIGSLAKKPAEVTRQGTQKLKFTPVLPARRQKKEEVKSEPTPVTIPQDASRGRGRGRGRGDGRGRGRGASRPVAEMTASGPFAMGPAMSGNNARRSIPRSNFSIPTPTVDKSSLGAGLARIPAPTIKKENDLKGQEKPPEEEEDRYSEPDEGVEIIDMEDVRQMDWMAPESLKKERRHVKKKAKKEELDEELNETIAVEVDAANALDLSESEEEEEFEDLIEHFAQQENVNEDATLREERLYFFQFPSPFPSFAPPAAVGDTVAPPAAAADTVETNVKRVSFADDVKSGSLSKEPTENPKAEEPSLIDGIIGSLEVYRSGAVKLRLQNGILLEVTAATQPSFLQHAVCLDLEQKRMTILGEVNKRFIVSPDIDTLLTAMEIAERVPATGISGEERIDI